MEARNGEKSKDKTRGYHPEGEHYCYREDTPRRGGWIKDVMGYDYVAKHTNPEGGHVYPVLHLLLSWEDQNQEYVHPLLRELEEMLERFGADKERAWGEDGRQYQLWYPSSTYGVHKIIRNFEMAAEALGWKKTRIGFWPGEPPDWVAV